MTDVNNCGGCFITCDPSTMACIGGECVCLSSSSTYCGNYCANTASDAENCGDCGFVCEPVTNGTPSCTNSNCGLSCDSGYTLCDDDACVDLTSDNNNCGGCDAQCVSPASCEDGQCED
jgi:hypothetical protein